MKVRGTTEELPSGTVRVRFRIDGALRTIDSFPNVELAEAHRSLMAGMLQSGKDPNGVTKVATFGWVILEERELARETTDSANERGRWRKHVETDEIGLLPVGEPDLADTKAWLRRLAIKGLSRQTRIHCLNLMRAVIGAAIERGMHKGPNPCIGLKIKEEAKTEEGWTFANPMEQESLISASPEPLDCLVEFAIGSGVREGEQAALRLADVHLDVPEPYITVRYGAPPNHPPKWGRIRDVQLFGRSLDAMQRWLAQLDDYCPKNPHGLAFPGRRGGFRPHDHILRWDVWKGSKADGMPGERGYVPAVHGIVQRAGITRDFRWHDLRHTCGTSLVNGWWGQEWTVAAVCSLLGHKSVTTTERYAHLQDTPQREAARKTRAFRARSVLDPEGPGFTNDIAERDASLELATFGLGSRSNVPAFSHSYPSSGALRGIANAALEAACASDAATTARLCGELASAVLAEPAFVLALRTAAGGAHSLSAGIELAKMVLESADVCLDEAVAP